MGGGDINEILHNGNEIKKSISTEIEIKDAKRLFYRRDEKWPLGPEKQQQCAKNYMLSNNVP